MREVIYKAIMIGCTLFLAAKGYGNFLELGIEGGYCLHYFDEKSYKNSDIGGFLGVNLPILPVSIVGNADLNWKTEKQSITVVSLMSALRYNLGIPLLPLKFYLGIGAGLDWSISEREYVHAVMGVSGVRIHIIGTSVNIFGNVRFKYLFPEKGSWYQLLVGVGVAYRLI